MTINGRHFALTLIAGLVLWAVSIPILLLFFSPVHSAAEFGAMFGAVDALFSGLALAGVVYTVLLQGEEMRSNKALLEQSILAAETAARIQALAALLQVGEATLARYARENEELRAERERHGLPHTKLFGPVSKTVKQRMKQNREALEAMERELMARFVEPSPDRGETSAPLLR